MNRAAFLPGFTLLEVLTAAILLGLLVSLLLSLFKQGEIAWSVGESAVEGTGDRQHSLVCAAREGAETVFIVQPKPVALRILSAWDEKGEIRSTRPIVPVETDGLDVDRAIRPLVLSAVDGASSVRTEVIVTSAGPDGKWETEDDLSTDTLGGAE